MINFSLAQNFNERNYQKMAPVKKIVREYIKNFPSDIRVKKVFLFGSYATGKVRRDSDIDLIVISPQLQKNELY